MNIFSVFASSSYKPLVMSNFQPALTTTMDSLFHHSKDKVVVIMGATGSGKSKLAIDLATHFPPAEVVNSDKIQMYSGLDIATNKVTEEECRGVPHHLLGTFENPNMNFTASDFCKQASSAIGSIVKRDGLPIIAGGSNSFIDALVNHTPEFRFNYECCFLWVDVSLPVLHNSLSRRVDRMIDAGQVDEVRQFFLNAHHQSDYTRGIRRAIGVPEFDRFLRAEASGADERTKRKLLDTAIAELKVNNCNLASRQVQKIHRLYNMWKRSMHRLDPTEVLLKNGCCSPEEAEKVWEDHVFSKSRRIIQKFLYEETTHRVASKNNGVISSSSSNSSTPSAMAAVTH
uniref:adenylate dimethylallyltransferase (ADP/ATP-dependent) n=1 Tax=Lotus japonicus TaxID=34305 RepID=Q1W5W4_LOTJA|nr:adenylate isopentenyltransferase [Lotus japonicus]